MKDVPLFFLLLCVFFAAAFVSLASAGLYSSIRDAEGDWSVSWWAAATEKVAYWVLGVCICLCGILLPVLLAASVVPILTELVRRLIGGAA